MLDVQFARRNKFIKKLIFKFSRGLTGNIEEAKKLELFLLNQLILIELSELTEEVKEKVEKLRRSKNIASWKYNTFFSYNASKVESEILFHADFTSKEKITLLQLLSLVENIRTELKLKIREEALKKGLTLRGYFNKTLK